MSFARPASVVVASALVTGLLVSAPAKAWVYPEHRDILLLTVQGLDAEHRAIFDRLWREARTDHEQRLCEQGADAEQGLGPACIDWAALAAIAGDHSCSSADLSAIVLESDWILGVAAVAAQLKADLIEATARNDDDGVQKVSDFKRRLLTEGARAKRINALRKSDLALQQADPEYVTRAGSNNAHFLLARPRTDTSMKEYGELSITVGAELNALGMYSWFHLSALQKATRLAHEQLDTATRRELTRAMLFDEAYAAHFLEDVFAAGHIAGTWGDASQRKGTHDYYNAAGLEVFTWNGGSESMVLMGDAHLRPEDAERAAATVRKGLLQVLETAAGKRQMPTLGHTPGAPAAPDAFDGCKSMVFTGRAEGQRMTPEVPPLLREVLTSTPVPSLGQGLGSMPRFRSELGLFTGLAGSVDLRSIDGGFTPADGGGVVGGVDLAARVGVGLDGVIGESGDGLMFLSLGLRGDSSSSNSIADPSIAAAGGNLAAAIPARMGYTVRTRMPFYLLPFDLLVLSPMYLVSPETFTSMAVTASNGGLIPWQAGWATAVGRFQFVAGRELGLTYYGRIGEDRVLAAGALPGDPARIIDLKSVNYDLPILEYRPYRSFASNQSSTLLFQLFVGADVPGSSPVVAPVGAPGVELDTVYSVGLRLVFDWRHYAQ